jgi:hypothetical protein
MEFNETLRGPQGLATVVAGYTMTKVLLFGEGGRRYED